MRECLRKVSPGDEIHCLENGRHYRVEAPARSDDLWTLIFVTELTPGILAALPPVWVTFAYGKKKKIVRAKKGER